MNNKKCQPRSEIVFEKLINLHKNSKIDLNLLNNEARNQLEFNLYNLPKMIKQMIIEDSMYFESNIHKLVWQKKETQPYQKKTYPEFTPYIKQNFYGTAAHKPQQYKRTVARNSLQQVKFLHPSYLNSNNSYKKTDNSIFQDEKDDFQSNFSQEIDFYNQSVNINKNFYSIPSNQCQSYRENSKNLLNTITPHKTHREFSEFSKNNFYLASTNDYSSKVTENFIDLKSNTKRQVFNLEYDDISINSSPEKYSSPREKMKLPILNLGLALKMTEQELDEYDSSEDKSSKKINNFEEDYSFILSQKSEFNGKESEKKLEIQELNLLELNCFKKEVDELGIEVENDENGLNWSEDFLSLQIAEKKLEDDKSQASINESTLDIKRNDEEDKIRPSGGFLSHRVSSKTNDLGLLKITKDDNFLKMYMDFQEFQDQIIKQRQNEITFKQKVMNFIGFGKQE